MQSEHSAVALISSAGVLVSLAAVALLVDVDVCRYCLEQKLPGDLRRLLTWSEVFAHGIGIAMIAVTIWVLDPAGRRYLPRILAGTFGAGLLADMIKLTIGRFRPGHLQVESTWDSFAGFLPTVFQVEGYSRLDHRLQSFPSAHTAVATGLALMLGHFYPRGRYLFLFFAILAGGQRLDCGAHYLSDTLAGAAVGCVSALIVLSPWSWRLLFHRWEQVQS